MQAGAGVQRLLPGAYPAERGAGHRADHRYRPGRRDDRRRRAAPGRRDRLCHGLPPHRRVRPCRHHRRGRPAPPGRLARRHGGLPRNHGRRVPEPVPDARPQLRARAQLDDLHDRGAGPVRAALPGPDRCPGAGQRQARGPAAVQRAAAAAAAARRLVGGRLRELVPGLPGGEPGAVARLDGRLLASDPAAVARRLPHGRGGRAGPQPKVAIVTGGASGIGAALAAALTGRGATVIVADIDESDARRVAERLTAAGPGRAVAAALDVTAAAAVSALVRQVSRDFGRLDLMVNNAGVGVAGAAEELTLDHWNRAIDVNLRGVIHGVHAAYPLMIGQRDGHIVSTASLAGLVPAPLLAPYAAAKHAVVGLSLALRAEARRHGGRVSVICPGFVDTPLLDHANPGLPQTRAGARARALARMTGRLYPPEALAADVLRGIARNRPVIVASASARLAWRAARYAPPLSGAVAALAARRVAP